MFETEVVDFQEDNGNPNNISWRFSVIIVSLKGNPYFCIAYFNSVQKNQKKRNFC